MIILSNVETMRHHVHVLYKHNEENRITVINEPPYDDAPLLFIGHTSQGNIVRYSNVLSNDKIRQLEQIFAAQPLPEFTDHLQILQNYLGAQHVQYGPAYIFPENRNYPFSKAIQITNENKELIKPYYQYTYEDFPWKQPCFVMLENNEPVSICCTARQTEIACEASVYTQEDYRGRGYSLEVVNAWANTVQKQGRIALYSTSADNLASQAVARKLGLVQYGVDIQIEK
ncbi:GNAT family N-acetyltransferase [Caldibacillus lycopersici]|uniref:GNAT family N-acetyltransferase n=1 Tax=Perspicuibacillus lycopersici TaxID=1325689 RepID=A0AAE3LPC2_9BACI|nr:GNAT family N-acetyltransferase [Perspicuibacillus lycopersici]MCU9614831.1 GNAT family N-acetyltransferase [Perspicuibacillus lycopersici]